MLNNEVPINNLLMSMFNNSSEAIFFFDASGKVISMNNSAELILDSEVLKQMAVGDPKAICGTCKGYTSEFETQTCQSCYLSNSAEDFTSFQIHLDTKDVGVIPYAASFQVVDAINKIRVLMLRNLTKQYQTQETLNQRIMVKSIIKAQEDERKRISRQLHDSVAQEMISSLVDLRVLKYMNIENDVLKKVQQAESSMMLLLDDIRHLSVELRPAVLDDLGLNAALRTHFKWIERNYGLIVNFSTEIESKRYEEEVETVVYRICQEAVFNALKYASVDEVFVQLNDIENNLELQVVDHGVGFDKNSNTHSGTGLGLYGMYERAELVKGQLEVRSMLNKGSSVRLAIPLVAKLRGGGVNRENYNR